MPLHSATAAQPSLMGIVSIIKLFIHHHRNSSEFIVQSAAAHSILRYLGRTIAIKTIVSIKQCELVLEIKFLSGPCVCANQTKELRCWAIIKTIQAPLKQELLGRLCLMIVISSFQPHSALKPPGYSLH